MVIKYKNKATINRLEWYFITYSCNVLSSLIKVHLYVFRHLKDMTILEGCKVDAIPNINNVEMRATVGCISVMSRSCLCYTSLYKISIKNLINL